MTVVATQTLYDWLLFLHVLAAMVWARRRADVGRRRRTGAT